MSGKGGKPKKRPPVPMRGTPAVPMPAAPPASSTAVRHSMQGNKGADTKPEMQVRRMLRAMGFPGYRLHWKVPGHPDIAYPGRKIAIFVNGCFWHRCPHCHPRMPKTHQDYWRAKFENNVARDERNYAELRRMGWKVVVVWECQLKKDQRPATEERLYQVVHI